MGISRRVVGVDRYNWTEPIKGEAKRRQYRSADRGEVIEVSEDEAARGEANGFLADPTDAFEAVEPTDVWAAAASDEALQTMTAQEITDYLASAPDGHRQTELDRVLTFEAARKKPRVSIVALGEQTGATWGPASEDHLADLDEAELVAYLGQVPEDVHALELDRIYELETLRDDPRVGILALHPDFQADPADQLT